eukprot:SAG31_NODE_6443_length_2015_cov_7.837161_1_plen_38_part_10
MIILTKRLFFWSSAVLESMYMAIYLGAHARQMRYHCSD